MTDPNPANNSAADSDILTPWADLSVTKSATPLVVVGQTITYTINFANSGPSDAVNVQVVDTPSMNALFYSATVTSGSGWAVTTPAVGSTGPVRFTKANVTPAETAAFQILVTAGPGAANSSLNNTVTTSTSVHDPNLNNNSASASTFVNPAATATTLSSSPNPSTYGLPVDFNVIVTATPPGAGTPTGTVTFLDGPTTLGTATLSGGTAFLTATGMGVGPHAVTAHYNGDGAFTPSTSATVTQTVNPAETATALASTINPSVFGQPLAITATVTSPGGTPTGTVTFTEGAVSLGTISLDGSGVATLTPALTVGGHNILATYNGDASFNGSVSPTLAQTVNKAATTTALTAAPNPSVFGQPVTFTATVAVTAPGAGTPSGTVTFFDGAATLGTAPLLGGTTATFSTTALSVAGHSITARYDGDAGFDLSTSAVLTQTVNKAATTTSLTAAPNPSVFGQSVIFTASVAVTAPGAGTPTGTVTFLDGATTLGTGTLAGSTATFSTAALSVAGHFITARYEGDAGFDLSTSAVLSQTVNKAATATTLNAVPNPSVFGQSVTFTATVAVTAPGAGTPTGTVTFLDGATTLGTGTLAGATATFSTAALSVAGHSITARYEGDAAFNPNTSPMVAQTVQRADTTTAVTATPNPSRFGQAVTFTATVAVAAPGAGTPTGSVAFLDGAVTLGVGALTDLTATFSTTDLSVAGHAIAARYEGDANFNLSTSAVLTQAVNKADTSATATSSTNPSVWGQTVTFTATVNVAPFTKGATKAVPGPTGTVTFLDGATTLGVGALVGTTATFATANLEVAAHAIAARYEGDGNYNPSTSPAVNQVVNLAATTTAVATSKTPACPNTDVVFTATVAVTAPGAGTPTGTVTFLDGATPLGAGPLAANQAVFTTSTLAPGSHTITARYDGDSHFTTSASAGLAQTISADARIVDVAHPTSVCTGATATLTAQAEGAGPFTYTWFESPDGLSFTLIPGATGAVYTSPALNSRHVFKAAIQGACGPDEKIVVVEVTQPPVLTRPPADVVTRSWQSAALAVECTGDEPLTIQWYEGAPGDVSRPVDQAVSKVLQTPPLDRDATYWVRISNDCGTVDSPAATVRILNEYHLTHAAATDLWWTSLTLVNGSDTAQPVTLQAIAADGTALEGVELPPLGPQSQTVLDLGTVFAPPTLAADFWVRATSKANLQGLLAFGTRDNRSRTALPLAGDGSRQLIFPYVVVSEAGMGGYYTGLTLVNPGTAPAGAKLEAYAESGAKLAETTVTLPSGGKYVRLLDQVFAGLADPRLIRSVKAMADQPLLGFELFGTLQAMGLAGLPAVPWEENPAKDLYYGMCFGEMPQNGTWYTGMTFLNLDRELSSVSGMVYDAAGTLLGTEHWELGPMQQLTREVWGLLDPGRYAAASYIEIGSYQPLAGFELVLSRLDPFRFDGLPGLSPASDRLVFPTVATGAGQATRLRLINKSGKPMTAVATAYDAAGRALAAYPLAFAGYQPIDLDVAATFPSVLPDLAWIAVEGDNILFGDAFVVNDVGQTLTLYPGLPGRPVAACPEPK